MNTMSKLLVTTLLASSACLTLALPNVASAADRANVLVFNEDSDKDTVPRKSRVSKRVDASVVNELTTAGIDVFDETAVTLDGWTQSRSRRADEEIIDIARSVTRPPIDIAIIYSIYASAKALPHTTKIAVRIEGRILDIGTGKRLDNFEVVSPREWVAKDAKCTRECILESIGDAGKILGDELGAVLTEKLEWILEGSSDDDGVRYDKPGKTNAYTLLFQGFTADEILEIEELLLDYSGYQTHRPSYIGSRRAEFWYETKLSSSAMNRDLKHTLDALDLRGHIRFSGRTFTIKRITLRGNNRDGKDF